MPVDIWSFKQNVELKKGGKSLKLKIYRISTRENHFLFAKTSSTLAKPFSTK